MTDVRRAGHDGPRSIHIETLGAARGDTLHIVALHGGPGFTGDSLRDGMGPLAMRMPVTLVDLPGCGRSSRHPGSGYPMAAYVDDVLAVLDQLDAPRIVLLGHAWGAMLATACVRAEALPNRIVALVFVNPLRILNEHGQDEVAQGHAMARTDPTLRARFVELAPVFARAREGDPAAWDEIDRSAWPRDMFATQFAEPPPPAWTDAIRRASLGYECYFAHKGIALQDEDSAPGRYDLADDARHVTLPTLIVASESDANYVAPPAIHARPLSAAMQRATLVEFEGLGHFPFVEMPERFANSVATWLDGIGR